MRKKQVATKLLQATEGLVATATDLDLFFTILPFALPGAYTHGQVARRVEDVTSLISEDLNYRTIKNTIKKLVEAGLIVKQSRRSALEIAITKLGRERMNAIIPTYQQDRPWDGHLYLVSYDIPAKPNHKRAMLREYLRRIGSVLLQESLWLTPYNPRDLIGDFATEKKIGGSILVSKLGTDGAIGNETLHDLIARVYKLDALNERYADFLDTYGNKQKPLSLFSMTTSYLSILKDDPQLPFALYPKDFLGEKAFHLYQTLSKSKS